MQKTSLLAYAEALENLSRTQVQVFKTLKQIEPANNQMISRELNWPINSVTPRIKELRKKGLVKEHNKAD